MTKISSPKDKYFTLFDKSIDDIDIPKQFGDPFKNEVHPLSILAAKQLQEYLTTQDDWQHNFGLLKDESKGRPYGKMFGVLVVETMDNEIGFLSAFSGKLANSNTYSKFVPPVFDGLTEGSFLNVGMTELSKIVNEIRALEAMEDPAKSEAIHQLKAKRKKHSTAIQKELFDQYHFINQAGDKKSLVSIFKDWLNGNPPSGAGECAAPKLLQYAFLHQMKPIALAEFWWGISPKSAYRKHTEFYPSCIEKCQPILAHMLDGIEIDKHQ